MTRKSWAEKYKSTSDKNPKAGKHDKKTLTIPAFNAFLTVVEHEIKDIEQDMSPLEKEGIALLRSFLLDELGFLVDELDPMRDIGKKDVWRLKMKNFPETLGDLKKGMNHLMTKKHFNTEMATGWTTVVAAMPDILEKAYAAAEMKLNPPKKGLPKQ